ncbi:MAG: sodium:calcium antiporter [Chloroflexi bacterium]|nr:sodium:calcium antiporter [Chloroflexota bacterium]
MSLTSDRNFLFIVVAIVGTFPAIVLFTLGHTQDAHLHPLLNSVIYGLGILSAAFLLSWAAEAFEHDISHGLALALVAVITVLPEYAVDFSLVWKAGTDPEYAGYAVANMTGANRLLIGIAWPLIVGIVWFKALRRKGSAASTAVAASQNIVLRMAEHVPGVGPLENRHGRVQLYKSQTIELSFLAAATIYAFTIPFKGQIDLLDAVVLIGLFGLYMYFSSRAEVVEPELVGPAALIGNMERSRRRLVVLGTFAFAAAVIFLSAEPFAEGMIETGKSIGIDEFLLIQWIAPLASEAPEIVVACIFAIRGDASSALGLLVSAKVNQWSLLVGSLPIVYSASVGSPSALPLDERQSQEVLLTAAQSLFAVVLLATLHLGPRGAMALFVLFTAQLVLPFAAVRLVFSFVYFLAVLLVVTFSGQQRRALIALPRRAYREAYKMTHHEETASDRH